MSADRKMALLIADLVNGNVIENPELSWMVVELQKTIHMYDGIAAYQLFIDRLRYHRDSADRILDARQRKWGYNG